jgi:hypothetical protein
MEAPIAEIVYTPYSSSPIVTTQDIELFSDRDLADIRSAHNRIAPRIPATSLIRASGGRHGPSTEYIRSRQDQTLHPHDLRPDWPRAGEDVSGDAAVHP